MAAESYAITIEEGVAVCRVFRNPNLDPEASARSLESIVAASRSLALEDGVDGMVLDLRRTPGAQSPRVERVLLAVAQIWEASGQRISFLVEESPVQKLQITRVAAQGAPRFGAVFTNRGDARTFAGAKGDTDPNTLSRILDRPSRVRGL
jgi:hypothetical protein